MHQIKMKPLSVNEAWKGRRFKTQKHKEYREALGWLLPSIEIDPDTPLLLHVTFYVSSKASDLDNLLKPFIDGLQDKYGFDDKWIYEIHCRKKIVKKGEESIIFEIIKV